MRRNRAERKITSRDPVYSDELVSRFINAVMRDGKKSTAQNLIYGAFDILEERTEEPGLEVFKKAVNNVAPLVEVRSRRVGGATYQVPIEVRPERRVALAFRWLIQYARARNDKSFALRLANELQGAAQGESGHKPVLDQHRAKRQALGLPVPPVERSEVDDREASDSGEPDRENWESMKDFLEFAGESVGR